MMFFCAPFLFLGFLFCPFNFFGSSGPKKDNPSVDVVIPKLVFPKKKVDVAHDPFRSSSARTLKRSPRSRGLVDMSNDDFQRLKREEIMRKQRSISM